MKVEFRESLLKDLSSINDKRLLARLRETIESLESAAHILEVQNVKKLRGGKDTIEFASANIGSVSWPKPIHSFSFAF